MTNLPTFSSGDIEPIPASAQARSFIHPLAALLLMIVDAFWTIPDMAAIAWIITIPACFFVVALPAYLIHKHMNKDSAGKSLGVATLLGILAAIPTPITGTVVGAVVLSVAGLRSLGAKR